MAQHPYVIPCILPIALVVSGWPGGSAEAAELGVRVSALHAETSLHGFGLIARWPLSQSFFIETTLDRLQYEQKHRPLSLPFRAIESVVAGVAVGREYQNSAIARRWFWTWGISAGFPTTGRNTGTASDFTFNAATEVHLTGSIGVSMRLSEQWSLAGTARFERHFIDWRLTDSGGHLIARENLLAATGLSLSVNYRF